MPDATVWRIAHNIASGLKHIHSCGLVHLDIKPANILIDASGSLKIGDFGMATYQGIGDDFNEGDQRYMAPELLFTPVDRQPSADVFSLSLTLYETCLVPGFAALPSDGEQWHAFRRGHAPPLIGRSPALNAGIFDAMSPTPSKRPSTSDILGNIEILKLNLDCSDSILLSLKGKRPNLSLNRSVSFRPLEFALNIAGVSYPFEDSRIKTPTGDQGSVWSFSCTQDLLDLGLAPPSALSEVTTTPSSSSNENSVSIDVEEVDSLIASTQLKPTGKMEQKPFFSPVVVDHDFSADLDHDPPAHHHSHPLSSSASSGRGNL